MGFKTTEEILKVLIDGKKIYWDHCLNGGSYCYLRDGQIVDEKGRGRNPNFAEPKEWKVYKEPKIHKMYRHWFLSSGKDLHYLDSTCVHLVIAGICGCTCHQQNKKVSVILKTEVLAEITEENKCGKSGIGYSWQIPKCLNSMCIEHFGTG